MALWQKKSEVEVQVVVQDEGIALIDQKIAEMDAATERLRAVVQEANEAHVKVVAATRELRGTMIRAGQLNRSLEQASRRT